jgi:multiple sugar transport system permease protein
MSTRTEVAAETAAEKPVGRRRKPPLSEGAKQERRLGLWLCAPAVLVMLAVTAYPVVYAVWLSL